MARVQLRLDMREGEPIVFDVPDDTDFQYVRGLALSVNGEDISRTPLYVHDKEYTKLHTICRRGHHTVYDPDAMEDEYIELMEW